jgi:RNA polymerase sigma-70 factor (ECF subfamily)
MAVIPGRDPLAEPEPLIRCVYAYVAYRIGPGPDAEDVTSETFERAVRYSSSYDARKGEPVGWLIGIARRCLDQRYAAPAELPLDDSRDAAVDDVEQQVVRRLTLAEAATELSERDRELLAMHYAGLGAGEIAELMGVRRNVIDVALHRALARVRGVLEREPETRASTL